MECIHAEDIVERFLVSCYADLKPAAQKKIESHYKKISMYNRETQIKTMTPEELAYNIARKQVDGK